VLIGKDHPLEQLRVPREGFHLAFTQVLDVSSQPERPLIPHLSPLVSAGQAPSVRVRIALEVFFQQLQKSLI
jgi:hypothetical protein